MTRRYRNPFHGSLIRFLAIALISVCSAGFADDGQSKSDLDAGVARYRSGDYRAAILKLEQALQAADKLEPDGAAVAASALWLGKAYAAFARYTDAEAVLKRAYAIHRKAGAEDGLEAAAVLGAMGWVAIDLGRLNEADVNLKRALSIRERILGADHPDVGESINDLGVLYSARGMPDLALKYYKRGLAIRERALGPNHADVGESLGNLALFYRDSTSTEDLATAESLFKRATAIQQAALGAGHPEVANTQAGLGGLYTKMRRYPEAEPLLLRALSVRESVFGPQNKVVVGTLFDLAQLYDEQQRYPEVDALYKRILAAAEAVNGPDHQEVASVASKLASAYFAKKRYAEADAMLRRALLIRERHYGPDSIQLVATLEALAVTSGFLSSTVAREREQLLLRALAIREKARGADRPEVLPSLDGLIALYRSEKRYPELEAAYRRKLAIVEKLRGPEHAEVVDIMDMLSKVYVAQKRYSDAISVLKQALAIREHLYGLGDARLADAQVTLADLYRFMPTSQGQESEKLLSSALVILEKSRGNDHESLAPILVALGNYWSYKDPIPTEEAEQFYLRGLSIYAKSRGSDDLSLTGTLDSLAAFYSRRGRYADADAAWRRSLTILEKHAAQSTSNAIHQEIAETLHLIGRNHRDARQYAEAERELLRAIAIGEKASGNSSFALEAYLNVLGIILAEQERSSEAEQVYRRAIALSQRSGGKSLGSLLHLNLAQALIRQAKYAEAEQLLKEILDRLNGQATTFDAKLLEHLAHVAYAQGKGTEAMELLNKALPLAERDYGVGSLQAAAVIDQLGDQFEVRGDYDKAMNQYRKVIEIRTQWLGNEHADVIRALFDLARILAITGNTNDALVVMRRARQSAEANINLSKEPDGVSSLRSDMRWASSYMTYLHLLWGEFSSGNPQNIAAEALEVAQLARASSTGKQVAKMAARFATGDDALARLARARQDAFAQSESLNAELIKEASALPDQKNTDRRESLNAAAARVRTEMSELDAKIAREFPRYRELTTSKPMALASVQNLLGPDEAMVVFVVGHSDTYVWAVRRDRVVFQHIDVPRDKIETLVRTLRRHLDLGADDTRLVLDRPFDVGAAHALYKILFTPIERALTGTSHLLIVPDGPLQSLPFGVLVRTPVTGVLPTLDRLHRASTTGTRRLGIAGVEAVTELRREADPTPAPANYADVDWLAKHTAITVLPSVGSLRALREFAKSPASKEPLGGFGNPVLEGQPGATRGARLSGLYSRGAIADTNEVRKLEPLPESADELKTIAAALKAPSSALRLGPAATERAVKETDLTRYRNLAFATHGLMAGEFKGLAEPALVFTPPVKGSELDDGLLTASEIAQLKLDADWVVLSACNTAAPDGSPGAEGLSGLAQAFFYAGARTLLVSHWSVSSEASVALTTRMFEENAKGATKAQALQRSMLALMQTGDKPHFSHPALWAPFVVVGEGGVEKR